LQYLKNGLIAILKDIAADSKLDTFMIWYSNKKTKPKQLSCVHWSTTM